MAKMLADGWEVQNQATRKQVWRWTTGVLTKQQVHTVTYVKPEEPTEPTADTRPAPALRQPGDDLLPPEVREKFGHLLGEKE
jgi:hypothetical protein